MIEVKQFCICVKVHNSIAFVSNYIMYVSPTHTDRTIYICLSRYNVVFRLCGSTGLRSGQVILSAIISEVK